MEYKPVPTEAPEAAPAIPPRIILHGGAGNISRATMTPERYEAYRTAMLEIIARARAYMTTPAKDTGRPPTALATATYAVSLFEDNPLFNAGRGAVFTRDGLNQLESAVMVSAGRAKRGVGVMGLRRVRNPVLLARRMLEAGDADLGGTAPSPAATGAGDALDVPGAQGHTQIYGEAAEALAARYGLPLVDPSYFYTQTRWDEHVRGLEREKAARARTGGAASGSGTASWSPDAYLPQGTVGAVALDADGVVCCATSTGGLTNKLTGRVGDTPVLGAGSWAETWSEDGDPTRPSAAAARCAPVVQLSDALRALLGDCLGVPASLAPTTTRAVALSGTGNGDSFLRVAAAHTVVAMARYRPVAAAAALSAVAGPGGVLQRSTGDRWGRFGEGEGGLIGIECAVVRDGHGAVTHVRTAILQDCNCGGMFRAWVDDDGQTQVRVFRDDMK